MATDKLFSVAGISQCDNNFKVRFANDIMRTKMLEKTGHTDIRLTELTAPTTKLDAVRQLRLHADFQDAIAQSTITDYLEANTPKDLAVKQANTKGLTAVKPKSEKQAREAAFLAEARAVALADAAAEAAALAQEAV